MADTELAKPVEFREEKVCSLLWKYRSSFTGIPLNEKVLSCNSVTIINLLSRPLLYAFQAVRDMFETLLLESSKQICDLCISEQDWMNCLIQFEKKTWKSYFSKVFTIFWQAMDRKELSCDRCQISFLSCQWDLFSKWRNRDWQPSTYYKLRSN